jgi:mono/diheme cytochrome c family protein
MVTATGLFARAEGEFKINGDAAKGAETFKLYCAACHGETGHGDGLAAAALNPKPRNFTDKALMDTVTDENMFKIIKEGGPAVGKSMFMTAWGPVLNDDQKIHDVAAFIRTLAK